MATSTLQQAVTLTRAQRDGVRDHVGHIISLDGNSLDGNSLDAGGVDREGVMIAIGGARIPEQLGWQGVPTDWE